MAALAALLAVGGARADQAAQSQAGRCLALDGDTLVCEGGAKIRLHGIDAPEMDVWPWGPLARAALDEAMGGGPVTCRPTGDSSHGRTVAACANAATGADLGAAVVTRGLATTYRTYLYPAGPTAAPHPYDTAEAEARAAGRGVWGMWVEP